MGANSEQPPSNWFPDPLGRFELRYWDGAAWTDHVVAAGVQSTDALERGDANPDAGRSSEEEIGGTVSPEVVGERTPAPAAEVPAAVRESSAKVPFFGARKAAQDAQAEIRRLQSTIDDLGLRSIVELEAAKEALTDHIAAARQDLDRQVAAAQGELSAARAATHAAVAERASIAAEIVDLRESVMLQEFGLYDNENPAESSVTLSTELESLRVQIKLAVRNGQATTATSGFTFNNSPAKGAKFVRDMSKLMLRSYNAEAENCLKSVRAGNLATAQKRLGKTVEQVERLGGMIDLHITPYYHRLRLNELELASRHLQALQIEKELERERREELRQQKQAEAELAREKERLEKERAHYANVMAALIEKGDLEGAGRIKAQLDDVEKAIKNVDYRAANIKAGYVYVISNIGSFGPEVVKIGMTRRLEPMDRVHELGDASVPFRFDVHALFFADNALSIESMLHKHFADRRLNRVNLRREYFRATPAEVLDVLTAHRVEVLEYTVEPAASEYRSSVLA